MAPLSANINAEFFDFSIMNASLMAVCRPAKRQVAIEFGMWPEGSIAQTKVYAMNPGSRFQPFCATDV